MCLMKWKCVHQRDKLAPLSSNLHNWMSLSHTEHIIIEWLESSGAVYTLIY